MRSNGNSRFQVKERRRLPPRPGPAGAWRRAEVRDVRSSNRRQREIRAERRRGANRAVMYPPSLSIF